MAMPEKIPTTEFSEQTLEAKAIILDKLRISLGKTACTAASERSVEYVDYYFDGPCTD